MKRLIYATGIASVTLLDQPITACSCAPHWDNDIGQPGVNHIINALTVFDDENTLGF